MNATHFYFVVEPEDAGLRLDVFLAEQDDPPLTRSQVRKSLDSGEVLVDQVRVKSGHKLRPGEIVSWAYVPAQRPTLTPQNLPISILLEDTHLACVDKPAGMVVHPSFGHPDGTLVNALLFHLNTLSDDTDELCRPGIVHRIDKDTSGVLVIAKDAATHLYLCEKFRTHDLDRVYHAIVLDQGLEEDGTFDTLHGRDPRNRFRFSSKVKRGKHAITHYHVLERFDHGAALVACKLETGRTHQIRMHFADADCPLLGDQLYGGPTTSNASIISRQALHARTLGFEHMDGTQVHQTAAYPSDFAQALEKLRLGHNWR